MIPSMIPGMIPLRAPAVTQGLGLFETLLAVQGRPIQAGEHFDRLRSSARALGFALPSAESFHAAVDDAAAELRALGEAAVRCLYLATGDDLGDPGAWQLAATASPLPDVTLQRRAHGRVILLDRTLTRALPAHKSTSYAVCAIALRRARAAAADEALFLNADGMVLEGTSTNVFALSDRTLITAPLAAGILPGVVRAWVLAQAARLGLSCEERPASPAELLAGSFLTSSLTLLAPIRTLGGVACTPPGAAFAELRRRYREAFSLG